MHPNKKYQKNDLVIFLFPSICQRAIDLAICKYNYIQLEQVHGVNIALLQSCYEVLPIDVGLHFETCLHHRRFLVNFMKFFRTAFHRTPLGHSFSLFFLVTRLNTSLMVLLHHEFLFSQDVPRLAEAYLRYCLKSMMEFVVKIVNGLGEKRLYYRCLTV